MATETATFASGCFWCSEAVYQQMEGVQKVTSGYMGGTAPNPTYEQVCTGNTGHAEVIQVQFENETISFEALVRLFFKSHDPTTRNRQGHDVGTQYRSAIFTHSDEQQQIATRIKSELDNAHVFSKPIVTEVQPAETFYPAEDYHQDFYARNKTHPYCAAVITPKLDKLNQS